MVDEVSRAYNFDLEDVFTVEVVRDMLRVVIEHLDCHSCLAKACSLPRERLQLLHLDVKSLHTDLQNVVVDFGQVLWYDQGIIEADVDESESIYPVDFQGNATIANISCQAFD